MSLIIKSELSERFLLEEDAIKGFKKAVANNQILLGMQILSEILDVFMEAFDLVLEDSDDAVEDKPVEIAQDSKVDLEQETVVEEPKAKSKKDKLQNEQK